MVELFEWSDGGEERETNASSTFLAGFAAPNESDRPEREAGDAKY